MAVSHFGYLFISLLLASLVHESGHAEAASLCNLAVEHFKVFLFIVYPGTIAAISTGIRSLPTGQRLRIYSAGIISNLYIAVIFWLIIWSNAMEYFWRGIGYERVWDGVLVRNVVPVML